MSNINSRQNWLFSDINIEPLTKDELIQNYIKMMFARTSRMFVYSNLPDYMRSRDIEYILQSKGYAVGIKVGDKPYILSGAFAGRLNEYLYLLKRL